MMIMNWPKQWHNLFPLFLNFFRIISSRSISVKRFVFHACVIDIVIIVLVLWPVICYFEVIRSMAEQVQTKFSLNWTEMRKVKQRNKHAQNQIRRWMEQSKKRTNHSLFHIEHWLSTVVNGYIKFKTKAKKKRNI